MYTEHFGPVYSGRVAYPVQAHGVDFWGNRVSEMRPFIARSGSWSEPLRPSDEEVIARFERFLENQFVDDERQHERDCIATAWAWAAQESLEFRRDFAMVLARRLAALFIYEADLKGLLEHSYRRAQFDRTEAELLRYRQMLAAHLPFRFSI